MLTLCPPPDLHFGRITNHIRHGFCKIAWLNTPTYIRAHARTHEVCGFNQPISRNPCIIYYLLVNWILSRTDSEVIAIWSLINNMGFIKHAHSKEPTQEHTFVKIAFMFCFVFVGFYVTSTVLQSLRDARLIKWKKTPETRLSCTDGQLGRTTNLPQASRKAFSHIKFSPLARLEPTAVRGHGVESRRPYP